MTLKQLNKPLCIAIVTIVLLSFSLICIKKNANAIEPNNIEQNNIEQSVAEQQAKITVTKFAKVANQKTKSVTVKAKIKNISENTIDGFAFLAVSNKTLDNEQELTDWNNSNWLSGQNTQNNINYWVVKRDNHKQVIKPNKQSKISFELSLNQIGIYKNSLNQIKGLTILFKSSKQENICAFKNFPIIYYKDTVKPVKISNSLLIVQKKNQTINDLANKTVLILKKLKQQKNLTIIFDPIILKNSAFVSEFLNFLETMLPNMPALYALPICNVSLEKISTQPKAQSLYSQAILATKILTHKYLPETIADVIQYNLLLNNGILQDNELNTLQSDSIVLSSENNVIPSYNDGQKISVYSGLVNVVPDANIYEPKNQKKKVLSVFTKNNIQIPNSKNILQTATSIAQVLLNSVNFFYPQLQDNFTSQITDVNSLLKDSLTPKQANQKITNYNNWITKSNYFLQQTRLDFSESDITTTLGSTIQPTGLPNANQNPSPSSSLLNSNFQNQASEAVLPLSTVKSIIETSKKLEIFDSLLIEQNNYFLDNSAKLFSFFSPDQKDTNTLNKDFIRSIKEVNQLFKQITVLKKSNINMISKDANLPVSVKNSLPVSVQVYARVIPHDMRIVSKKSAKLIKIGAKSSGNIEIPLTALSKGSSVVEVQVLNNANQVFCKGTYVISINYNAESMWTIIVLIAVCIIFFISIIRGLFIRYKKQGNNHADDKLSNSSKQVTDYSVGGSGAGGAGVNSSNDNLGNINQDDNKVKNNTNNKTQQIKKISSKK